MYYVTKRLEIAGCHRLKLNYESQCSRMHGHNWIITYLDHGDFNELLPFNPTAENIAKWTCDQIPTCYKVTVQESDGNSATYIKDEFLNEDIQD